MLSTIFSIVSYFIPDKKPLPKRNSKWSKLRNEIVQKNSKCSVCGKTTNLEVHHIKPYHLYPELELVPGNCMVLCKTDHLIFGHLYDWTSFNVDVEKDVEMWKEKIKYRPKSL